MKKVFLLLLLLYSCVKDTKPVVVKSITNEDFEKLKKIETYLIEYRSDFNKKRLLEAKVEIDEYFSNKILNKEFVSRLWGLKGEIAFLENNTNDLDLAIKNIKEKIPHLYLLRSWKESNKTKKLKILEEGEKEFDYVDLRIKVEIGLLYFELEEYTKAYTFLEEALEKLPYSYKKVYGETKEKALKLSKTSKNKELVLLEKVSFNDFLNLIVKETKLLNFLNISKIDNISLEILRKENLIPDNINLKENIKKKDLIFILFNLMEKNNLNDVAKFYRKFPDKYKEKSPVKDLSPEDNFYYGAMYFIERGIIELPDGKNLYPLEEISGKDVMNIIEKIKVIK